MQEFKEMWTFALEELRQSGSYSNTFISFWFNELEIVDLNEERAVVFVQSSFKRDIIEKSHSAAISAALERVLGYKPAIVFTSDKNVIPSVDTVSQAAEPTPVIPEPSPAPEKVEEPTYFTSGERSGRVFQPSHADDYTFENFIVGSSNKFAHSASLSVATHPACLIGATKSVRDNNPLFIYGPSGLGKTHLLYAIINQIKRDYPEFNIIYVKGEEFTNQMIESISRGQTAEFRERYRKADVLLIDDIHFIAGKESTQEEFFHTFNDLYEHKKQIILTSDRPARDIQHLEERLRTRFEWGMPADIQPPDFELRVAIMDNKASAMGFSFSKEVLTFLAERLTSNIRQMEGAIKRIIASSRLYNEPVTVAMVSKCIADLLSNNGVVKITPDAIIERVSSKYGVEKGDIFSKKKTSTIAKARHITIYLLKKMLDMSYPQIGDYLKRDHTTAMHSFGLIDKEIKNDSSFEIEINELIKDLG